MANDIAKDIIARFEKAKTSRVNWESYWQEVCELVLPNFSNTFFEGGYSLAKGAKKDRKRYDGTGEIALQRFAAVMESMLTPRNSRWHMLTTTNRELNRLPRVREWFDEATDTVFKYRYANKANFGSQVYEHYQALGALGTGSLFIDKMAPRGLRYATIHVAQVYFYANHQGIVDEALRGKFRLTAEQAVKMFTNPDGSTNLPEEVVKAANSSTDSNKEFDFIHCVKPNDQREAGRKDWRGMAFVSYYVECKNHKIVRTEGYNTFPYAISRYVTAPGELYGRSPAMQALTNIKVLNEQKKTVLKQGHRVVDPVLLAHDDGVLDGFSLRPGAINPGSMSADGKRLVDVLPTGNIAVGEKMMEMERAEIHSAFLIDLFQILVEGPQMTATEVIERVREKGILISPIMGRQESEFLGPMVERELDLLLQQQLLPPMPGELIEAGAEYDIIYDSPLSRAQKAEQAAGLMRTVGWAAEIAGLAQTPEPLDHFDWDVIIPELSHIHAVPNRWMMTPEKLMALREARHHQMATRQVIEAGPTIAAITKQQRG